MAGCWLPRFLRAPPVCSLQQAAAVAAVAGSAPRRHFSLPESPAKAIAKQLREQQDKILNRHVFLGTTQYFSRQTPASDPASNATSGGSTGSDADGAGEQEPALGSSEAGPECRFVVCGLGPDLCDGLTAEPLLDIVLPGNAGHDVLQATIMENGCLSVLPGEVDALGDDPVWEYGFFRDTALTVFRGSGDCVFRVGLDRDGNVCLHHYEGDGGPPRVVPLVDIARVAVDVSGDSYESRSLRAELKDGSRLPLIVQEELDCDVTDPLAYVMTTTEWLVKTAGHLAIDVRRAGGSAGLRVSKALTEAGNPWIAKRNARWKALAAELHRRDS